MLAQAFGIRGIPDVRAFRDAKIVSQFTGALPPAQISAFLDTLLPSEADVLAKAGDEASLRAALEADPNHSAAAIGLARILLARGEIAEAKTLLEEQGGRPTSLRAACSPGSSSRSAIQAARTATASPMRRRR